MDLKYKIIAVNQDTGTIDVLFSNDSIARVTLVPPPANVEELDELVRPYAPSTAQLQAAQDIDYQMVIGLIDVERSTRRQDAKPGEIEPPEPEIPEPQPEPTLGQRRAQRWEEIKQERSDRLRGAGAGVNVDGQWFHADGAFRQVITQGIRLYEIDELPADHPTKVAVEPQLAELRVTYWKKMDNQFVLASQLLAIRIDAAMAVLTKRCHEYAEQLKAQVYASDTPEDIAVRSATGWPETYSPPNQE